MTRIDDDGQHVIGKAEQERKPRYDEVYDDGVRRLDWMQFSDEPVCDFYQSAERGMLCTGNNCPCDLYQSEDSALGAILPKDVRPMTPEEADAAAAFVRGKSRLLATIPLGGVSHD